MRTQDAPGLQGEGYDQSFPVSDVPSTGTLQSGFRGESSEQ